uniref:Uncharacterized protein n=1 Tax=Arundo donax TaxID=35708 RepID=A0A0A9FWZ6_ARUDO
MDLFGALQQIVHYPPSLPCSFPLDAIHAGCCSILRAETLRLLPYARGCCQNSQNQCPFVIDVLLSPNAILEPVARPMEEML